MILTIGNNGNWFCEVPRDMWPDDDNFKKTLLLDFDEETGDKRQELVFIGQFKGDERETITKDLDACLLTEEEMIPYLNGEMEKFEDPFEDWDYYEIDGHDHSKH